MRDSHLLNSSHWPSPSTDDAPNAIHWGSLAPKPLPSSPHPGAGAPGWGTGLLNKIWGIPVLVMGALILCVFSADLNQSTLTFPIDNVHLSRKVELLAERFTKCDARGHHHHVSLRVRLRRPRLHLLAMVNVGEQDEYALLAHGHHRLSSQF
jgi:hypothetical protein